MASGAGPVGLLSLLSAHAAGCSPLVITDLVESRLEFAKKLVPDVAAVLVGRDTSPEVVAAQVRAAAGTPLKAAIECSGFEGSVTAAIYVSDSG